MNFKTPKLDAAVTAFKALHGGHHQLYEHGQFYVTKRTMIDLTGTIETEIRGNLRLAMQPAQVEGAISFFRSKLLSGPVMSVSVAAITQVLDLIEHNGDMATIRVMFKPTAADRANAQRDFDAIWSHPGIPAAPLLSISPPSLGKAQAAFKLELDRCFQVLRTLASKLLEKRGITSLPAPATISDGAVGGAFVHDTAAGTATEVPRQTIRYNQAATLAAAMARMKAAIDAGGYVHCGVLSGARHEHSAFPQPEHHVLVFAHDRIDDQDAFLFWDPDTGHSSIDTTGWGAGFGVLLGTATRLSTAISGTDLTRINRVKESADFGDHLDDKQRHCYQVYFLQTLPMARTVRMHTRLLEPPSRSTVDEMLHAATMVYAAHGIELIEVSREVFSTAGAELDRFQTLIVGYGDREGPTPDVTELHEALRAGGRELGIDAGATEILIVVVRTLVPANRGYAGHPLERPGAVLSASLAGRFTLAHELGHLFGLEDVADADNVMFVSTGDIAEQPPELSADDVIAIMSSPLAQA